MPKQIISRAFFRRTRNASFRLLVIALAATGLTVSAWAWLAPTSKAEPPARAEAANAPSPARSVPIQGRIEAEIITIRPEGFEPSEITRQPGRFVLAVSNRSGLDEVTLRLSAEGGAQLLEVRMPLEQPDWQETVDLTPGSYLLTEAAHTDWVCRITIAP